MTIAPVKRSVQVSATPAQAFDLFASRMGEWWPPGKTIGNKPAVSLTLDPMPGGKWAERDQDGVETQWGKVLAWEPPHRLLLAWQLDASFRYDPGLVTEVELTFAPHEVGTLVTLEHRNLERFGAAAHRVSDQVTGGWSSRLADYAAFAYTRAGGHAA